jgi:hypothetical protein
MTINLTHKQSEEYFYNALCNGLGYIESGYGLELKYSSYEAQNALKKLKDSGANTCYEDIIMHDKVQLAPVDRILEMANENDDADTADVILQSVFFGEVIFG